MHVDISASAPVPAALHQIGTVGQEGAVQDPEHDEDVGFDAG